jgi:hypothetical protein
MDTNYHVLKNLDGHYYFSDFDIEGLTEDIGEAKIFIDLDWDDADFQSFLHEIEENWGCKLYKQKVIIQEI